MGFGSSELIVGRCDPLAREAVVSVSDPSPGAPQPSAPHTPSSGGALLSPEDVQLTVTRHPSSPCISWVCRGKGVAVGAPAQPVGALKQVRVLSCSVTCHHAREGQSEGAAGLEVTYPSTVESGP